MNDPSGIGIRSRLALALLAGLAALGIGLFGSGGQTPSWAAPDQNPYMQTVPTRPPPTVEPAPTPELAPSPTSTHHSPENEEGDKGALPAQPSEGEDVPLPAQTPEKKRNESANEASPTRLPEQENDTDQTPVAPGQVPEERNVGDGASTTPQRADLSLTKTVDSAIPNVGEVTTFTKSVTTTSASMPASASLLVGVGSLGWLYALGLGVLLILIGISLAKRA